MSFFDKPFANSKQRYDDFDVYQMLCDTLWIHDSKRKAVFGVDDFYEHARQLLTAPEHAYRVEKIKNTPIYTRFISN